MNKNCSLIQNQYWEFRKENKKLRKKERKHTLNKESDQENVKEKVFRLKNINSTFNHLVSVICRFDQMNISKE